MAYANPTITKEQFEAMLKDPAMGSTTPSAAKAYLESKGYKIQGYETFTQKPAVTSSRPSDEQNGKPSMMDTIKKLPGYALNVSGAGVGFTGNLIGTGFDIAKKAQEIVPGGGNGVGLDKVGQFFKDTGNQFEETAKAEGAQLGVDPEGLDAKLIRGTTKVLTGAALSAPLGGPIRAGVTEQLGGGFAAKAAGVTLASPVDTTAIIGGFEGRTPTKGELTTGAAIDLATLGIGHLLTKYAPDIFRIGANPKGKNYLDIEFKAGDAVGTYGGTKKMIVNQADTVIKNASGEMDDLLEGISGEIQRTDLITGAKQVAADIADASPETAAEIVKYADDWASGLGQDVKPVNSYKDLRDLKTKIGSILSNIFDKGKAADPKVAAQSQALVAIWGKIDEILDGVSPEVAALNQQMNTAFSLKIPLSKDLEKPALQNLMSMLAVKNIPGGTTVMTLGAGGMEKLGVLLDTPGVPETVKAGILKLLEEQSED